MSENVKVQDNIVEVITEEDAKNEYKHVKLSKVYRFEGKEISELDLSGIFDLSVEDMIASQKMINADGTVTVLPEMDIGYCMNIAARACRMPVEFFRRTLNMKDGITVKSKVTSFFFGEE